MASKQSQTREPAPSSDDVFDFAPGWMPDEGETLVGAVIDRSKGEGEFGEYLIVTLRPDAGQSIHVRQERTQMDYTTDGSEDDKVAVHCFGAVLDNAIRKLRPQVGQRLAFKKLGKRLRKGGDEQNTRDWFNAWAVRDLSVKTDDDLFGPAEQSWTGKAKGTKSFDDDDEPPF